MSLALLSVEDQISKSEQTPKFGKNMSTCFVMQPFDGSTFDKLYEEVFAPAIKDAGLEPYRVDQDPKVSIPIQDIERGIQQSQICLAEITLDNPNVWFELGFAIACGKEVVLICSDARKTKFPFDVQHRTIITYKTGTPSDFEKLRTSISLKIRAYLEKSESLHKVSEMSQLASEHDGFSQHELIAIAAVTQNIEHADDHTSIWQIKRDMEANGFTPLAATIALRLLTQGDYLSSQQYNGQNEQYYGYTLTGKGWNWVLANQNKFALKKKAPSGFDDMDDKIPF